MPFGSVLVRATRSNVSRLGGWIGVSISAHRREQRLSVAGSRLVIADERARRGGWMAFATEHPVLAHSEYRAVDEVVRTGGRFEVVSPHQPAGDQPAAIDELEHRIRS